MLINMGIYSITNKINGKRYVGSAKNIRIRWMRHKRELKKDWHENSHLQRAWNKHGEENFIFEIICQVWDENKLIKIEQTFLDLYQAYDDKFGYNIARFADAPMRGRHFSEESKQKLSVAGKGKKTGIENHNFGKKLSKETCLKMSNARMGEKNPFFGKHHTEENRQKMSKSHIGIQAGEKNPMYGKHLSVETRQKMSVFRKGKYVGKENHSYGKYGESAAAHKLIWKQVREIREKYATGKYTHRDLAREYGVVHTTIGEITRSKSWKEEL